jgi:isochorismate synthase
MQNNAHQINQAFPVNLLMTTDNKTYNQLKKLQKILLSQNIPFASYRLPGETEIITLVQHYSTPEKLTNLQLIDKQPGFIIAPFIESKDNATFILKPDCIYFSDKIEDIYLEKLAANNLFLSTDKKTSSILNSTSRESYIKSVNNAVNTIKRGQFHKVVISKIRKENLPVNFKAEEFFLKLCEQYPHAMVYLLQLPETGCWMGATPEELIIKENGKIKTASLAGTQISTGKAIKTYEWSHKEIEEQKIVTDFVEHTLLNSEINIYKKKGPENYQAANLVHLKTTFEFSESQIQNPLIDLLKKLHPTPSVGGLPQDKACDFILATENYERSYYSGFLGPVNINEKTNIFVNLRCLQLFDKEFVLYSGAGITSSSVAEKEWEETDNKMMTMMNVLKISNH